jgi:hypothetical protein
MILLLLGIIRCRGNVFTEPLPRNDTEIYIDTDCLEEFMKYAAEMGSGVMICISSLIKIGSDTQRLIGLET